MAFSIKVNPKFFDADVEYGAITMITGNDNHVKLDTMFSVINDEITDKDSTLICYLCNSKKSTLLRNNVISYAKYNEFVKKYIPVDNLITYKDYSKNKGDILISEDSYFFCDKVDSEIVTEMLVFSELKKEYKNYFLVIHQDTDIDRSILLEIINHFDCKLNGNIKVILICPYNYNIKNTIPIVRNRILKDNEDPSNYCKNDGIIIRSRRNNILYNNKNIMSVIKKSETSNGFSINRTLLIE